jgi:hypothetical protein
MMGLPICSSPSHLVPGIDLVFNRPLYASVSTAEYLLFIAPFLFTGIPLTLIAQIVSQFTIFAAITNREINRGITHALTDIIDSE